jgi:non-specific serine/threonine protein kinase
MWLDLLNQEHENLRAALSWSLAAERQQSGDTALLLAGALARFWHVGDYYDEGRRWLMRTLASTAGAPRARMKALYGAAWLVVILRDLTSARALLDESIAIAEELHDDWARAWILHMIGRVAYMANDPIGAREFGEKSLRVAEAVGDPWLLGWVWHFLGLAAYIGHDDANAYAYYDRSLAIRRELGHLEGLVLVLHLKGLLPHRAGDLGAALALYREALDVAEEINSGWFYMCVLPLFVSVAAEHQPVLAARLAGAVSGMSESTHTLPIPITEERFNAGVELARRKLSASAFHAAWAQGRALSLEAAVALAREVEPEPHGDTPANLTAAEVEVLRRLARGRTTREIATELVAAVSTVDRHITHIYAKIGCRGRAAVAAFAVEHGLS